MSEQTMHTPGPWFAFPTPESSNQEYYVIGPRRNWRVATVDFVGNSATELANARLLAAAPGLLDALEQALEFVADHEDVIDGDNGPLPNRAMVLAASLSEVIAKATGSASKAVGTTEGEAE